MQQIHVSRISALALAVAGVLAFGGQAHASGFQLKESSVKAMGRAFAGSGSATGDASVVTANPAAMSTFKKTTVQADVTMIDLSADFTGGGLAAAGTPLQQPLRGGNGGDAGDQTPVPAISAIFPMGDSGVTLGAMLSAPFGLKTEYDAGWVGRYTAVKSEVKTYDFTMSAAFDFGSNVSFGLGLVYERAEATLSKSIDFGSAICGINVALCITPDPVNAPYGPQKNDGFIQVDGDDTAFGWIAGLHIHPRDNLAIGYTHRAEISHDIQGTADFTVPANVAPLLALGAPGQFTDSNAHATLATPAIDTISVTYGINDDIRVMGDVSQTQWSSLQQVAIDFTNNPAQATATEEFKWNDTTFWSLGAEWDINDQFTLRGGYAEDQTPTHADTRTPRLPDGDRQWFSVGLTWTPSESWEINGGYTRIVVDDPAIQLTTPTTATSGSTLVGTYNSSVNLWGLSAQYRF